MSLLADLAISVGALMSSFVGHAMARSQLTRQIFEKLDETACAIRRMMLRIGTRTSDDLEPEALPRRSLALDLLLPMNVANDVQASLQELMPIWIDAHGKKRAGWIYRIQVLRVIFGHHASPAIGFFERVLKIVRG